MRSFALAVTFAFRGVGCLDSRKLFLIFLSATASLIPEDQLHGMNLPSNESPSQSTMAEVLVYRLVQPQVLTRNKQDWELN
jgi:hypothetical protein